MSCFLYSDCRTDSMFAGEDHDCAVIATAIVLGKSYNDTLKEFTKCGRQPRRPTNFGVVSRVVWLSQHTMRSVPVKSRTIRTVERELTEGAHFILTGSHLVACVDGTVYDWTRGRLHRVKRVFQVLPITCR